VILVENAQKQENIILNFNIFIGTFNIRKYSGKTT